ncbi:MAG TPA: hypothetical protein VND21_02975 [Planctomycetota bacterium]|nr:hypothetical protein [Planctomycetota bacterium]
MTSLPDQAPGRGEHAMAYSIAFLATLLWVACVMPGARLHDPSLPDDLATPMHRGALVLVPALILLVAAPFAAILSTHALGVRGLLAWSSAFVSIVAAGAMIAAGPKGILWGGVVHLTALGLVSVRDGLRVSRAAAADEPEDVPPTHADLRLVLCVLAFLVPASVLAIGPGERASWYAAYSFVMVAAAGDRFSRTLVGLRRACAACLALLGTHLVVSVRYLLSGGTPAPDGWTWAGSTAFFMSVGLAGLSLTWLGLLVRPRRPEGARA